MPSGDPRRPAATAFVFRPTSADDKSPDMMAIMAVVFGLLGLLMKYRMFVWQSVVCCIISLAGMKTSEIDVKQITSSLSIGFMGLVMAYLGPGAKFFRGRVSIALSTIAMMMIALNHVNVIGAC